jgi:hypothetical protein
MFFKEIYILILKMFAHLQQVFKSVPDASSIVLPLNFPIPTIFSKPLSVFYASDEIWLLGENNFDYYRPLGQPLRAVIFSSKTLF